MAAKKKKEKKNRHQIICTKYIPLLCERFSSVIRKMNKLEKGRRVMYVIYICKKKKEAKVQELNLGKTCLDNVDNEFVPLNDIYSIFFCLFRVDLNHWLKIPLIPPT